MDSQKNVQVYDQGPIRPPSEAESLLIRVVENCPWNKCNFCNIYKGETFRIRPFEEVKQDIDRMKEIYGEVIGYSWKIGRGSSVYDIKNRDMVDSAIAASFLDSNVDALGPTPVFENYMHIIQWIGAGAKSVFLQDADALCVPTRDLLKILSYIKEKFPHVERIATYGRSKTCYKKSESELKELRDTGLREVNRGVESGFDLILGDMILNKGITQQQHIDGGQKVKNAGLILADNIMLGVGGTRYSYEHALGTSHVINKVNPDYVRFRTLGINDPKMLLKMLPKRFSLLNLFRRCPGLLTERGIVLEERLLIEHLEGINSKVESNHTVNLLPIKGKLPKDKEAMLSEIDRFLELSSEDALIFILGRRNQIFYGWEKPVYNNLDDMKKDSESYNSLRESVRKLGAMAIENAVYRLRGDMIYPGIQTTKYHERMGVESLLDNIPFDIF